jgi:hypothetical protein
MVLLSSLHSDVLSHFLLAECFGRVDGSGA